MTVQPRRLVYSGRQCALDYVRLPVATQWNLPGSADTSLRSTSNGSRLLVVHRVHWPYPCLQVLGIVLCMRMQRALLTMT